MKRTLRRQWVGLCILCAAVFGTSCAGAESDGTYLVIDLSSGARGERYPVSTLAQVPEGGWSDAFKTTKLVLRKIPAGSFEMGSLAKDLGWRKDDPQHPVKLTGDFYVGVFEVTQRQWELVMGDRPSYFDNPRCYATRPVESVSYEDVRGSRAGSRWPANNGVDDDSFLGRLRAKSGITALDLPTEAQWEYACRAGTKTAFNSGKDLSGKYGATTGVFACTNLDAVGRYEFNGGAMEEEHCDADGGTAKVGSYLPNAWGLYDMHGNVAEWCLDAYGKYGLQAAQDPRGSLDPRSSYIRILRGGDWGDNAGVCRSASRGYMEPDSECWSAGLRLSVPLQSVTEVELKAPTVFDGVPAEQKAELERQVAALLAQGMNIDPEKADAARYMVVDLSGGAAAPTYPVSYLPVVPDGGWGDEFRTEKLVLRKIPAGTFVMGIPEDEVGRYGNSEMPQHPVTLTKPFYIGVFEITQRQWELVMGNRPSFFTNGTCYATRPVERVVYETIRGNKAGSQWPENAEVDASSFMGKMRARTAQPTFDLPTEAQWEYACRAGTYTSLNSGKNLSDTRYCKDLAKLGRYFLDGYENAADTSKGTAKVGSYLPNAWGLYDMHGNVSEWCLDWDGPYPTKAVTDPRGAKTATYRILRSSRWNDAAWYCRSGYRNLRQPHFSHATMGFRAAMTVP